MVRHAILISQMVLERVHVCNDPMHRVDKRDGNGQHRRHQTSTSHPGQSCSPISQQKLQTRGTFFLDYHDDLAFVAAFAQFVRIPKKITPVR